MQRLLGMLCVAGLVVLASPVGAETAIIKVRDDYITPHFRVLVTGDEARFVVEGANGHTITSYPGSPTPFDSSPGTTDSCETDDLLPEPTDCLTQGSTYAQTFERPGTYDYYCKIHGNPNRRPTAAVSAAAQPCGMCGQIVVKTPSSSRPASRRPTPTLDPDGSVRDTPSPSASASVDPTASPSVDASVVAAPGDAGVSRSTGRILIAVAAIVLLAGVGYLVWRRFLGTT